MINATNYSFRVAPVQDGIITVGVAAGVAQDTTNDLGNTAASPFTIRYDGSAPTPQITGVQTLSHGIPTLNFTVDWRENVTGFDTADVVLSGITATGGGVLNLKVAPGTDGKNYTFGVIPAEDGTLHVDIAADRVKDIAGNDNLAADRFSIAYERAQPPPPQPAPSQLVPVIGSTELPGPTSLDPVPFTLEFNRHVNTTTLAASDIEVSSGTVRDLRWTMRDNGTFGESGTGTGQFDDPLDVAVNGTGHIFVVDHDNDRVQVFDRALDYVGSIGNVFFAHGVAFNGTGHIFVAESYNNRVRVYDSLLGHVADITSSLSRPTGVAVNGTGHLFVAENTGNSVAVFDAARNHVTEFSESLSSSTFSSPTDVAVDPATGNIYVADTSRNRIAILDRAGNPLAEIGSLATPNGITVDPATGNIFVAEQTGAVSAGDERLQVFNGTTYLRIATVTTTFGNYTGIAVDGTTGTVYAAEKGLNHIRVFDQLYTFSVAGAEDGAALTVHLPADRVEDTAENGNVESNTVRIEIALPAPPAAPPVPAITSKQGSPTNVTPVNFNVTFDRGVTGFAAADITLTGAAAPAAVTALEAINATHYYFDVVPTAPGNVTVDIAAGVAQGTPDGVDNAAADRLTVRFDDVAPAPRITGEQTLSHGVPTLNLTVAWGERVTGFEAADITLGGLATGGVLDLAVAPGTDGKNYTFGVVPTEDGTLDVDIAAGTVQDIAGNDNTAANRFSIDYDTSRPTVLITSAQTGRTNATTLAFNVTFSESVTGFEQGDIQVGGTAATGGVTGFGSVATPGTEDVYGFELVPSSDGTLTVDVDAGVATNGLGNTNTEAPQLELFSDRTVPVPVITTTQPSTTGSATVDFNIGFNETVTGFTSADIAVSGTASPGAVTNFASINSGANYTFDLVASSQGTVQVDVAAGAAHDLAGSPNTAAATLSVDYDPTRPTVLITSAQTGRTNATTLAFNVTFSESVNGFEEGDIQIGGTASHGGITGFGSMSTPGTEDVYGFELVPSSDGTVTVDVADGVATNGLGNTNTEAPQLELFSDRTVPVPVITTTQPSTTGSATVDFNIGFNETVTGFTSADIAVSGTASPGAVTNFASINSGANYTFDLVASSQGTVQVDVAAGAAHDLAGSPNTAAATLSVDYDPTRPTVLITSAQTGRTNATTLAFNVTFSESVNGFEEGDIQIGGTALTGGVTGFGSVVTAGSEDVYKFELVPSRDGTVTVDVADGVATNGLGNTNTEAPQLELFSDRTVPVPVITTTQPSTTGSATVDFNIGFNETVTGFTSGDITVSGTASPGAVTNFASINSGANYTFDLVASSQGTVQVDIAAGAARDLAGSPNTAVATLSVDYDPTRPTVLITSAQTGRTNATPLHST